MKHLTHAGGVVFRLTSAGPVFLVVQASGNAAEWVLPKGHIEAGESPEQTAVREVREEAGVVARPIEPVGDTAFTLPRGDVHARFFLMRFVRSAAADEERKTAWLPYERARTRLTFDDQRRLLDRARARIEARIRAHRAGT
jgi:8-oxo-dGTP pyrophosphatase MutT (NUDIX family)